MIIYCILKVLEKRKYPFKSSQVSKNFFSTFIEKNPCICAPAQFKSMLFKDQYTQETLMHGSPEKKVWCWSHFLFLTYSSLQDRFTYSHNRKCLLNTDAFGIFISSLTSWNLELTYPVALEISPAHEESHKDSEIHVPQTKL